MRSCLENWMEMMRLATLDDPESTEKYVEITRSTMETATALAMNNDITAKALEECTHTVLKVPTTHDGDYDVEVLVHTPKSIADNKNNAAVIYAHSGGIIALSAHSIKPYLAKLAVDCGVVVFNVDYRLAPEAKCPENVKDFYSVLKYVVREEI